MLPGVVISRSFANFQADRWSAEFCFQPARIRFRKSLKRWQTRRPRTKGFTARLRGLHERAEAKGSQLRALWRHTKNSGAPFRRAELRFDGCALRKNVPPPDHCRIEKAKN